MISPIITRSYFAWNMRLHFIACIVLVSDLSGSGMVLAANFGGPNAVGNIIEDDARPKAASISQRATQGWFDWKQKLQEDHGFSLGLDYTPVYLNSSENGASGEDKASSGMLRVFGTWDLLGRVSKNTGSLVYTIYPTF